MSRRGAVLDAPTAAPDRLDLAGLQAAPRAQVNLLPPEVYSKRSLGKVKARLGLALVGVLLLAVAAFVYAAFAEKLAADELAQAQDEVARLQQEQLQYAEVPLVKGYISAVEAARELGTATEVLWPDYLRAVQAVTPEGVAVVELTTEMPGPITSGTPSANPLDSVSVGSITFTGQAATLPDLAAWMEALDRIPGFSDASFSTAELTSEEGVTFYAIVTTIRVDETVFAGRFGPEVSE